MEKRHPSTRGVIALLPLGLALSLLLLALPSVIDEGHHDKLVLPEGANQIVHKLDISKYSEQPKEKIELNPSDTSYAKRRREESGFRSSNEKLTFCTKDGECESQFLLRNIAGEIRDLDVNFLLGFSEPPREATLWQSIFFGREARGGEAEQDIYRWIPVDDSHFSFTEDTSRAFLLRYDVTPCTNGTWNVTFYSPYGPATVQGKYASVCPLQEIPRVSGRGLTTGESIETIYGEKTVSTILRANPSSYWDGSSYRPID
ncbi:MAG: hypothetical protein ABIF01_04080, partial [Candidatus Micrarchaeota archaeon]